MPDTSLQIDIQGMNCGSCVGRVEKALREVDGVAEASVNLATARARVGFDGPIQIDRVLTALKAAGYPGTVLHVAQPPRDSSQEIADLRRQVLIAAFLVLPVFLIEMGGHLYPPLHHWVMQVIGQEVSHVFQFLLIGLTLAVPGRVFFRIGIPALLKGAPDMNALVALGAGSAFVLSTVVTFLPSLLPDEARFVYFESAGVIVVLILLGRFLEARSKGQAGQAIASLIDLAPKRAVVLRDGQDHDIACKDIILGDVLRLRPGEKVAVDGVVVKGATFVDESMLTGEPVPVSKAAGDGLRAGTVNTDGSVTYRAEKVGADTVLAQIIDMVSAAQGAKLPIQNLVDRITLWFVPAVMAIAALAFALWFALGPEPAFSNAFVVAVTVLIIACPCAMGLAVPVSIVVGTGRAAQLGVLFRRGDALQRAQSADYVVFDKTGTLTVGRPSVTDVLPANGVDEAVLIGAAASIEAMSEHPIAHAIVEAATSRGFATGPVEGFQAVAGFGAKAQWDGQPLAIGSERFMSKLGLDAGVLSQEAKHLASQGKTPVFVALGDKVAGVLAVSDTVKADAGATISGLQDLGLTVVMLTGDRAETAQHVAQQLGITSVISGVLPSEKAQEISKLQASGKVVFVGDGINDAPALAQADVGIALGTGTDVAIESADVVLMGAELTGLLNTLNISRKTLSNIRQNLVWAFGYNVLLIPVAAGALWLVGGPLLSPMLAAGAMALSSVFVVSNALRLRWVRQIQPIGEDLSKP